MNLDQEISAAISRDIPGFKVVAKNKSKLMKFFNFFVRLFNDSFMSRFTTTIYPKIYVPAGRIGSDSLWKTKAHEWVHLSHARNETRLIHSLLYGFPQILALLALLSLGAIWGSSWWLMNLAWLLCLAPIPAYFRMKEEMDAYAMSLACNIWRYGGVTDHTIGWITQHFTTGRYYFMWPFKDEVQAKLEDIIYDIKDGKYDDVHPYDKVRKIIEARNE